MPNRLLQRKYKFPVGGSIFLGGPIAIPLVIFQGFPDPSPLPLSRPAHENRLLFAWRFTIGSENYNVN